MKTLLTLLLCGSTLCAGVNTPGLQPSNNLSDVVNASTARTNLGLGSVNNTADASKYVAYAQGANTLSGGGGDFISAGVSQLVFSSFGSVIFDSGKAALFRTGLGVPHLVSAPANAADTGVAGDWAYDASFVYVCTATNTWKRAALSTW